MYQKSDGLFIYYYFNLESKSKIFFKLDSIIPKVKQLDEDTSSKSEDPVKTGGFEALAQNEQVAYLVNKGLDGDMDIINSNKSKFIRGKVKAIIVKINRGSVERPPMPELADVSTTPSQSGGFESLSKDEQVAYLVNKGLDGDMDSVNKADNKVIRAEPKP